MEVVEWILSNFIVVEIVTGLIKVTVGAGLCFGALKWRRGLLTTTAVGWGAVLGALIAIPLSDEIDIGACLLIVVISMIVFPILTYTIPGVNRFVLGFLVGSKLLFMLTTVLAKNGEMEIEAAIIVPLVIGTIVGIILMAWTQIRVSAFVLGCAFIGASEIAPVVSEWVNKLLFSVTGNPTYLFDPIDLFFALFKVELTDAWTLIATIVFMTWGGYKQIRNIKSKGISLDTPLIAFESAKGDNGKIYTNDGEINTL